MFLNGFFLFKFFYFFFEFFNIFLWMNELLIEDKNERKRNSKFQRREFTKYSKAERAIFVNDLNKVIIPYNFIEKKYDIDKNEIEFYQKKQYLLDKLIYFNSKRVFKFQEKYSPNLFQRFLITLFDIIFFLFIIYLSLIILTLFSFNLVLFYLLFVGYKKLFSLIKTIESFLLEKIKKKEIKTILNLENNTKFCQENNLKWTIGQSCYWLELQKF